jgi:ribosomal protein S25
MKNFWADIILFSGIGVLIYAYKRFSFDIPFWYLVVIFSLIGTGSKMIITDIIEESQNKLKTELRQENDSLREELGKGKESVGPRISIKGLDDDELYQTAKEEVLKAGKVSTSYLQRKLGLGYTQASKLVDMLERRGVIGHANGEKPREILIQKKIINKTKGPVDLNKFLNEEDITE